MSFEEELHVLCGWFTQKTEAYIEASNKEPSKGFDSPLDVVRKSDVQEYNRRLRALKEKYGVQ